MASNFPVKRPKRSLAEHIKNISLSSNNNKNINDFLDTYLNHEKPIQDEEEIDWCRQLIAGGNNFDEFSTTGSYLFQLFTNTI